MNIYDKVIKLKFECLRKGITDISFIKQYIWNKLSDNERGHFKNDNMTIDIEKLNFYLF